MKVNALGLLLLVAIGVAAVYLVRNAPALQSRLK
jgi:hypothetical protein